MNTGYRLRSSTLAIPVPPTAPPAYTFWREPDGPWRYDGPHLVAAILIGCEELGAPARLHMSRRRAANGKEVTYGYVDFEDNFDERHFEPDRWHYMPVAFVLLPADCAEWESIIVPSNALAFSEEAAKAIVEQRNAARDAKHG